MKRSYRLLLAGLVLYAYAAWKFAGKNYPEGATFDDLPAWFAIIFAAFFVIFGLLGVLPPLKLRNRKITASAEGTKSS